MSAVSELIKQVEEQPRLDRLGRPNYGWNTVNANRAKQEWRKFELLLTKEQWDKLKHRKNISEVIRTYIEWGLENDG